MSSHESPFEMPAISLGYPLDESELRVLLNRHGIPLPPSPFKIESLEDGDWRHSSREDDILLEDDLNRRMSEMERSQRIKNRAAVVAVIVMFVLAVYGLGAIVGVHVSLR